MPTEVDPAPRAARGALRVGETLPGFAPSALATGGIANRPAALRTGQSRDQHYSVTFLAKNR